MSSSSTAFEYKELKEPVEIIYKIVIDDSFLTELKSNETIEGTVIEKNRALIEAEIANIKKAKATRVIIALGTERQTVDQDLLSTLTETNNKGSFVLVAPLLQNFLQHQLEIPVGLDLTLMPDVYNELESGTTYKRMLNARYKGERKEEQSICPFDGSKISLVYYHANNTAVDFSAKEIIVKFFNIPEATRNLFKKNNDLVSATKIYFDSYTGGSGRKSVTHTTLNRTYGYPNAHLNWSVFLLALAATNGAQATQQDFLSQQNLVMPDTMAQTQISRFKDMNRRLMKSKQSTSRSFRLETASTLLPGIIDVNTLPAHFAPSTSRSRWNMFWCCGGTTEPTSEVEVEMHHAPSSPSKK